MQGSLGSLSLRDPSNIQWSRPDVIFGQTTRLYDPNGESGVKQGELGDCYFLGTIAGLAQKSPELLLDMFVFVDDKTGIYAVRMYHNRETRVVVIDDLLPHREGYSEVLFGRSFDKSQVTATIT